MPKLADLRASLRSGALERELEDRPDAGALRKYKLNTDGSDAMLFFGRHRGRTLVQIWKDEPGYLNWVLESDFDSDLKDVVRYVQRDQPRAQAAQDMNEAAKKLEAAMGETSKFVIDEISKAATKVGMSMKELAGTLNNASSVKFETPRSERVAVKTDKHHHSHGNKGFRPKGRRTNDA